MRRLTLLSGALALLLSSCAATLRLHATAPMYDGDGACGALTLYPVSSGAPRVLHFQWAGPASGEDSVSTTAGTLVTLTRSVPPGLYTFRVWASDAGGAGCDTTATTTVKAPPAKPVL